MYKRILGVRLLPLLLLCPLCSALCDYLTPDAGKK